MYPEFTLIQVVHARALSALGRDSEAVQAWQNAHDLNPFDPEVQAALVAGWMSLGDAQRAQKHRRYERILKSGGSSSPGVQ